jgi:hypothetical protein
MNVATFRGKRYYIAMVETAAFVLPVAIIYFGYFRIFLAENNASDRKHALIGFFIVLVIAALVWTNSLRTKVTSIRSSHEIIVTNVWRSYRIPCNSINQFTVGSFDLIRRLGPKLPVVLISYSLEGNSKVNRVPVLASFSAGKNSGLLDEFELIGSEFSIPCDLSKMIY